MFNLLAASVLGIVLVGVGLPSGLYVIDDMLPQPNWPDGHAEKAAALVSTLEKQENFHVTKPSWGSGVVLATRR